jgi:translation initiation factor IF-1
VKKSGAGGSGLGAGARGRGNRLVSATVVEERPSLVFQVVLENQQKVLAHLAGMKERNFVRLVPGDKVEVELSPHDLTRGRIIRKVTGE